MRFFPEALLKLLIFCVVGGWLEVAFGYCGPRGQIWWAVVLFAGVEEFLRAFPVRRGGWEMRTSTAIALGIMIGMVEGLSANPFRMVFGAFGHSLYGLLYEQIRIRSNPLLGILASTAFHSAFNLMVGHHSPFLLLIDPALLILVIRLTKRSRRRSAPLDDTSVLDLVA